MKPNISRRDSKVASSASKGANELVIHDEELVRKHSSGNTQNSPGSFENLSARSDCRRMATVQVVVRISMVMFTQARIRIVAGLWSGTIPMPPAQEMLAEAQAEVAVRRELGWPGRYLHVQVKKRGLK